MTLLSAILTTDGAVVLDRFPESTIEMDGRDRDTYPRYDDRPPRLRSSSTSNGRRGGQAGFSRFDDDLELSDDPPSWQDRFGSSRRRSAEDLEADRQERRDTRESSPPAVSSTRRHARAGHDDLLDERMHDFVADPYDRLRRVSERRSRRPSDDQRAVDLDAYDVESSAVRPRPSRRSRDLDAPVGRRETDGPVRVARPVLPQQQIRAVGTMLARSSQDAGALAQLSGAAIASALALSVMTLIRIESTGDWLVTRLDAGGDPTRWSTNESLWRVPLLVLFATIAGLVIAWRLRRHDPFAAQFTLVSTLLLHGFGWVAAGRLLF